MTNLSVCKLEALLPRLRESMARDLTNHTYQSNREVAAALALSESLLKKFSFSEDTTDEQNARALSKFFDAQRLCARFQEPTGPSSRVFHQVRRRLASIWARCPSVSHSYAQYWDFGPGASANCQTKDVATKYEVMSTTNPALAHLFFLNQHHSRITAESRSMCIVRGSKLSFVPKTQDISRVTCSEPVANMALQKVISAILTDALKREFKIDLATQQSRNRRYARWGSFSGAFATIDLESASDTISLGLCAAVLPPQLHAWLHKARCRFTVLSDGRVVRLNMISSMGNDFTFPLQTLIFACICEAVMDNAGISRKRGFLPFCVNGDDIVVPATLYGDVTCELRRFGFLVNMKKSFSQGPFRESCGGDYYHGYDVRGVYLKRLSDKTHIYSAINRLRIWSRKHGISLYNLILLLRRQVTSATYVPLGDDISSGLWSTRRQALSFSDAFKHDQSLVAYKYVRKESVHKPSRRESAYWLCTRMVIQRGKPCSIEKRPTTKMITAIRVTSIWPEWADVARLEVRAMRSKALLAALTSQGG